MAIAYDSATNGGYSGGTSISWSHTFTGSDGFCMVAITTVNSTTDNFSNATYDGTAYVYNTTSINNGTHHLRIITFFAIPTGAKTIEVTFSTSKDRYGASSSYTGVKDPGGNNEASQSYTGTANPASATATSISDNAWGIGAILAVGTGVSGASGTVVRVDNNDMSVGICDSNGPTTPAGALTLTLNNTSSRNLILFNFVEPPIPDAFTPAITFF